MLKITLPLKVSLSILFFLLLSAFCLLLPNQVNAETFFPWGKDFDFNQEFEKAIDPNDPSINSWKWMYDITAAEIGVMADLLVGTATASAQTSEESRRPGILQLASRGTDFMLTNLPPINTKDYLASINPLRPVYAQTSGATVLSPVLGLWGASVKIAYSVMVIVLVISGFMIMLRTKIDPRTVVTIYSILPRVAISLILITLSYAISGLFVDSFNVLNTMSGVVLKTMVPVENVGAADDGSGGVNVNDEDFHGFKYGESFSLFKMLNEVGINGSISTLTDFLTFGNLGEPLVPIEGEEISNDLIKRTLQFIFALAIFLTIIMLLFKLIGYWVGIFFLTIASPFVFLIGALPGYSTIVTAWFRRFATSILVFVAVNLVLNIAIYFYIIFKLGVGGAPTFGTDAPMLIGGGSELIFSVIVFGTFLFAGKVPDIIEEALKTAPSAGVGRAGVQLGQVARKIPFVGGFAG